MAKLQNCRHQDLSKKVYNKNCWQCANLIHETLFAFCALVTVSSRVRKKVAMPSMAVIKGMIVRSIGLLLD